MEAPHSRKRQRRLKPSNKYEIRKDFVTTFSKELVLNVFSFLSFKELVQCAAVSMEWCRMANDEMLWKPLFHQQFRDPLLLEDRKTKFQYNRRSSVTRYGGSWKAKYRIHHNWLLGKCYINDVADTFNNNDPLHPHQLQFLHDTIFVVQNNSSIIDIWRYVENGSALMYQLQSTKNTDGYITFFKLIEGSTNRLVAGYSNGGFTLWEISGGCCLTEITNYNPSNNDKVTSIGMEYPMILVCTESMKLSVFHITQSLSLELVHCLQSPIDWSPVVIDIQKYHPKRQYKNIADLWKVVVCFGLSGGSFTSSIGVQELVLSTSEVLSSKHGFALDFEPVYPSSNTPSEQITAMAYSPPHLITAHPNNTMKQYFVRINDNTLDISFKRTLYGHTFKVDALAIDASRRKLVSGDRSGIKIWDLSKKGECQVTLNNHNNQSSMDELPDFNIKTLGFDEDKIFAVVNSIEKSFVRLWSFNSLK